MRRKYAVIAAPLVLALAGCSATSTPVGDKSGAESLKAEVKSVDEAPSVQFDTPINVSEDTIKVLKKGDGQEITEGDKVMYRLAAYDGTTGKAVQETYTSKTDTPLIYGAQLKESSQALYDGLKGQKKGATIAYIPKAASDAERGVMIFTITDVQDAPEFKELTPGKQFGDAAVTKDITVKYANENWVPQLSIPKDLKPAKDSARLYGEPKSDGATITDDMKVSLKTAVVDIPTGKTTQDTYSLSTNTVKPTMADLKKEMPALYEALKGQKVGQTIVYVPKAVSGSDPSAMVLTVTGAEAYHTPVVLSQAEVKKLRDAGKLPTIKENGDKKVPTITFPENTKAPQDLVVETLKEGTGAAVKATDTLSVRYSGWAWDSKKNFDQNMTADKDFTTTLDQVIPGWQKGLVGQKVGSTVMLVVPKDLAYGDAGQGDAQGDLVFYVKINKATAAK